MSRSPLGPGSELDVLLLEAFHAYRRGLLRQPLSHSSMPPRDFDALLFLSTSTRYLSRIACNCAALVTPAAKA
jgi:hypothetical protein